tara:strand:- start:397 stop:705 length:309 start_codon:yes stop_codon:yes gene_type:complete
MIKKLKLRLLAEAAADYYGVPIEKLRSKCRKKIYTRPRHICQFIAADAGVKQSVIAYFWKVDHASVIYGCRMVAERIANDQAEADELKRFMEYAKKQINVKR